MASWTGASGWTWGTAWGDEQEEDNEDGGVAVSRVNLIRRGSYYDALYLGQCTW